MRGARLSHFSSPGRKAGDLWRQTSLSGPGYPPHRELLAQALTYAGAGRPALPVLMETSLSAEIENAPTPPRHQERQGRKGKTWAGRQCHVIADRCCADRVVEQIRTDMAREVVRRRKPLRWLGSWDPNAFANPACVGAAKLKRGNNLRELGSRDRAARWLRCSFSQCRAA